ncbi:hypothetical protein ASZ78_014942 [Callipepla squamata]|uniref:Aminopeptidase n=1 Tax=Callipepla squamata TaxID=9009 RepID=A0A226N0C2_CALSU|nr:hypothetical protein ASZ78_014942 [Callipepla squamata]
MGVRGGSGLYVGRGGAALCAALLLALLVALLTLAALYGRCRQPPLPARPAAAPGPDRGVPGAPTRISVRRLPRDLLPLRYELQLWPRVRPGQEGSLGFSGQVNITVRCRRDTRSVELHSAGLRSHEAAVRGPLPHAGTAVEVEGLRLEEENELAVLELREPLLAGRCYVLQLRFQGRLQESREGLFLTRYTDLGRSSILVASHMEPAYARRVYPCFDEPDMKATFNIRIVHDPSYVALSNMPAIDVSEMKDENGSLWSVTTFNTTLRMSTYLTAFVVCDLDYVNRTERGNEIRIWARKEAIKNGYADHALNITGPIFSFLEDLFNISYPLPKTDLIALPDFKDAAMEHWGLMTFTEPTLLYLPSDKFTVRKTAIAIIVSHELAHQACGKKIQNIHHFIQLTASAVYQIKFLQWGYVCLTYKNENNNLMLRHLFFLFKWFGNLVTMNWWNDLWLKEGLATYFENLGTTFVEPKISLHEIFYDLVVRPALKEDSGIKFRSVSEREDNVIGSLLNMFDGITYYKSYLKEFAFSNANQDDLWIHMHNTWIVPISWMRNGSSQPLMWLDNSSKVFPEMQVSESEYDWILLNVNLSGYYRVNYDQVNLKRLVQLLENDPKAIPAVSRFQLLDDIFELTKFGYIEIEAALELTKYLAREDELYVWNVVLANLVPENGLSTLKNYEVYPLLKKYLLKRMLPIFRYYADLIRQDVDALEDDYFAQ